MFEAHRFHHPTELLLTVLTGNLQVLLGHAVVQHLPVGLLVEFLAVLVRPFPALVETLRPEF